MTVRRVPLLPTVLLVAIGCVACDRKAAPPADSVAQARVAPPDVPWVSELGPVLAIPGDSENTAIVLFPAQPSEGEGRVSLVRTAGDSSANARLTPGDVQVCGDVATAQLSVAGPSGWTLAVAPATSAVRLDSIESASSADSSALAAGVARLASAVADDGASRFAGLPFAVLAAHRVRLGASTLVIARVVRRIPQEAMPLEERTLIIGERSDSAQYELKYALRSSGGEDSVEHHSLLGVARAGEKHFVILEIERQNGSRYEILERAPDGDWRLRWSRTLVC